MKSQCPLPPQILKCSIHIQRSIPPRRIRITPVIRPVCAADQHIFDIRRGHENLISFYQSPFHDLRHAPAVIAAAALVPVMVTKRFRSPGPYTFTAGAQKLALPHRKCKSRPSPDTDRHLPHCSRRAYDLPCVTRHGDRMIRFDRRKKTFPL